MLFVIYCSNGHYLCTHNVFSYEEANLRDEAGLYKEESYECDPCPPKFCTECGSTTIDACTQCKEYIIHWSATRPSYCGNCGTPFPWTLVGLEAAEDYANELEILTPDEKDELKATFKHLTRETPRSVTEANRFTRLLTKVGPQAAQALTKMLLELATDAAKKHLGL